MYADICAVYVHTYVCVHIYIYIHASAYVCVRVYEHVYPYVYGCAHAYPYANGDVYAKPYDVNLDMDQLYSVAQLTLNLSYILSYRKKRLAQLENGLNGFEPWLPAI